MPPHAFLESDRIILRSGIGQLDSDVYRLQAMFQELQLSTVEAAAPDLDFFSFSTGYIAQFFAIMMKVAVKDELMRVEVQDQDDDAEQKPPKKGGPFLVQLIGFVYVTDSFHVAPATFGTYGELNMGIIVHKDFRAHGFAKEALSLLIPHVLLEMKCHRLQASLMDGIPSQVRMMGLLVDLGMVFEGKRRRSFFTQGEWKDVYTFTILDTDYVLRRDLKLTQPNSLWEELFSRHLQESQDLLNLEERLAKSSHKGKTLKKTPSMVSIKQCNEDSWKDDKTDPDVDQASSLPPIKIPQEGDPSIESSVPIAQDESASWKDEVSEEIDIDDPSTQQHLTSSPVFVDRDSDMDHNFETMRSTSPALSTSGCSESSYSNISVSSQSSEWSNIDSVPGSNSDVDLYD